MTPAADTGGHRQFDTAALVLFIFAGAVRAATVALATATDPTSADAGDYFHLARSLAAGSGFLDPSGHPNTFRPPGYPLFLGLVFTFFGDSVRIAYGAQALVDLATLYLIWLVAKDRLGSRPALLVLGMLSVSLSNLAAAITLLSEGLSCFLLALTVAIANSIVRRDTSRRHLALGIALGALVLTRSIFAFWPIAVYAVLACEKGWPVLRRAPVGALAFIICIAPWAARNQRATGHLALTTQSGITIYSSYVVKPDTPFGVLTDDENTRYASTLPPVEADRFLKRETVEHVLSNPLRSTLLLPLKLAMFLVPLDWEVIGERRLNYWYVTVFAAALATLPRAYALSPGTVRIAAGAFLYLGLMCLITYGSPRLRLPVEAFLCLIPATAFSSSARVERGMSPFPLSPG